MTSVLPLLIAALPISTPLDTISSNSIISPATQAWQITTNRRYDPTPQELPFQFYASMVFRDRWKIVGALELQKRTPEGMEPTMEALSAFNGRSIGKINGYEVLWTQNQPKIQFTSSVNTNMTAFGYAYWGYVLGQVSWINAAERMSNLWLASPSEASDFIPSTQTFTPNSDPDAQAESAIWYLQTIESGQITPNRELEQKILDIIKVSPESDTKTVLICQALNSSFLGKTHKDLLESSLKPVKAPTNSIYNLARRLWATAELTSLKKATPQQLKTATQNLLRYQSRDDQVNNPSLPNFGAIGTKPGSLSNDAPYAAIALCRAGEVLQDAEIMTEELLPCEVALASSKSTKIAITTQLFLPIASPWPMNLTERLATTYFNHGAASKPVKEK